MEQKDLFSNTFERSALEGKRGDQRGNERHKGDCRLHGAGSGARAVRGSRAAHIRRSAVRCNKVAADSGGGAGQHCRCGPAGGDAATEAVAGDHDRLQVLHAAPRAGEGTTHAVVWQINIAQGRNVPAGEVAARVRVRDPHRLQGSHARPRGGEVVAQSRVAEVEHLQVLQRRPRILEAAGEARVVGHVDRTHHDLRTIQTVVDGR